ncbi:unnamed protein product [Ixodes persulcatus]
MVCETQHSVARMSEFRGRVSGALRGKANACTGAATVAADPMSARLAEMALTLDEARSLRVIFTCVTRKNLITLKTATLRPSQPISLAPRAAIKTQLLSQFGDPEKKKRRCLKLWND